MVKKTPDIRFNGFFDDWEQRKFKDLGVLNRGKSKHRPRNASILYGGKYPFVQTGDVAAAGLYLDSYSQTYNEIGLSQSKLWDEGTLLITIAANIAESTILNIKAAFPDSIIGFETRENNAVFIKFALDRMSESLRSKAETSSQANLNLANLSNHNFNVPNCLEQEKVATFFEKLEKTIALHLDKQKKLDYLKKVLFQKMFPERGSEAPVVRFTGFSEPWEKCNFNEIVTITMGQSPKGENYTDNPNDHILVQGNADMKNGKVVPRVWTTQATKTAEPNDIILSVRAPVGDVGKTDFNVVLGRGVAAIKGNEFIFQYLLRMKQTGFWTKLSTGSTFESINSKDIKEADLLVPSTNEQHKIGGFFNYLDNINAFHQRKIDNLVTIKKTFLNRMFI